MLVLTRCPDETLVIDLAPGIDPSMSVGALFADGPLVITVAAVHGRQVRLGITATPRLHVLRGELKSTRYPAAHPS